MSEPIKIPDEKHMSSLDGISLTAIDTDSDTNLTLMLANLRIQSIQVLAVIPIKLHNTTDGYVVVTYDATEDPRAEPNLLLSEYRA